MTSDRDYSDLRAVYVNCTLKRSPEVSNTQGLADKSIAIMEQHGVAVDVIRAVDHEIATGVQPDMTEHGWERDDWPALFETIIAADILVLLSPIWLGEKSSVCTQVIERLYGNSHILNEHGQYAFYGRVGGCIITGNEDGAKHCAMNILYSLQHLGYTIPPQADSGWLGEAGPGPSYLDPGSGGPENDFHQPQHHVPDLEPPAPRAHAQGRRRHPRPRQPAFGVGRRLSLRLRQPGLPLSGRAELASAA
jgi:multimeric flavodoxin WrbA